MKTHKPTYLQGRKCLKCGAPISDQTHQNRKHCPRVVLPDGSIDSCKDDRNALIQKERDEPHRKRIALQKMFTQGIDALRVAKGDSVSLEDLDRYGINLEYPVYKEPKDNGLFDFYYTHHRLEQLSLTHVKIHPHVSTL